MRRSITGLVLAAAVAIGGCGDDEPEQAQIPAPAPTQRVRPDTTTGDTARRAGDQPGGAARPGEQAGQQPGQPSAPGGEAGQGAQPRAPTGQAGARPGSPSGGQPGAEVGQRLYTVQVAAFMSADSAQKWAGRLSSLDLPVWMSMAELGGTTYYRVRVGAVPTVQEARRLGALMTERFEWPVWVAPVTPSDRMPADAVTATRRVLGGD